MPTTLALALSTTLDVLNEPEMPAQGLSYQWAGNAQRKEPTYLSQNLWADQARPRTLQTQPLGVSSIFAWCNVFKVVNTVVPLVSVYVIYLLTLGSRANERGHDKLCYWDVGSSPLNGQACDGVSLTIQRKQERRSAPCILGVGQDSSYPSVVADLVNVGIPGDGNRSPNFRGSISVRHDGSSSESLCSGPLARLNVLGGPFSIARVIH